MSIILLRHQRVVFFTSESLWIIHLLSLRHCLAVLHHLWCISAHSSPCSHALFGSPPSPVVHFGSLISFSSGTRGWSTIEFKGQVGWYPSAYLSPAQKPSAFDRMSSTQSAGMSRHSPPVVSFGAPGIPLRTQRSIPSRSSGR